MYSFNFLRITFFLTVFFQLDLEKDLESQGPFDFLLHKFTEIITLASQDDQNVRIMDVMYLIRNIM